MTQANVIRLPTEQEVEAAKQSSRTLAKYADADRVQLSIKVNNQVTDDLILSGQQMQLLLHILAETAQGNAVSIMPIHAELSTQEAANILNVSRPHLVKLLEQGELKFHKIGSHRRILAQDLMTYKKQLQTQRHNTLDELTALSQTLGMGYE